MLAKTILDDISSILDAMPHDITIWGSPDPNLVEFEPSATLTEIVKAHLNLPSLFRTYLQRSAKRGRGIGEVVGLVERLIESSAAERADCANSLLQMMGDGAMREALTPAARDWLVGVALFFRTLLAESRSYLSGWVGVHSSSAPPALTLAIRTFCAETYRPTRDYHLGLGFLLEIQDEIVRSMSESELLVWHCLKAQWLIDWMEPCKEMFQIFPTPAGRSGEISIVLPMMDQVWKFVSEPSTAPVELRRRAANILLYLVGRYVPENVRVLSPEERKPKLQWLRHREDQVRRIGEWFRASVKEEPTAAFLDTLGYFKCKMNLATSELHYADEAVDSLLEGYRMAVQAGDQRTQRLLSEHVAWALEYVR